MKKKLYFITVTMLLVNSSFGLNVKDFGAKGDGKNDDTQAIMKAISALQVISTNQFDNGYKPSIYIGGSEELYFPLGTYLISSTIKLGHYIRVRGENAIITTFSGKRELVGIEMVGWQCNIVGLQLANFNTALKLNNQNLDAGHIVIRDCKFFDNDLAISLDAQSSITNITESSFYANKICLDIIRGDKVFVNKCWITSGKMNGQNPAQIVNRSVLHMDDMLLVPTENNKNTVEAAWINNYGVVSCNFVRQGGEPGSMCLINNFASATLKSTDIPNGIIVTNSDSYACDENDGKIFTPATVRLFAVPNQIYLQNIRGLVDAYLINFTRDTKSSWYKKLEDSPGTNDFIKITIADIVGGRKFDNKLLLPDNLVKYISSDKELNEKASRNIDKKPKISKRSDTPDKSATFTQEILLTDIQANYLLNFHANPNIGGSGNYHGGVVGIFRVNGIYYKGNVSHELLFQEIFNRVGNREANERDFSVDYYWKSTGTKIKKASNTDLTIVFKFKNSTAAETFNLVNLDLLK